MAKNKLGRPPMYDDPQELFDVIEEYFDGVSDTEKLTITGLVLHCGFCDRQSFYEYEEKPDFTYTIKRARLRIENSYEFHLFEKTYPGAIFALKNFGWTDKKELEHSGKGGKPIETKTLANLSDDDLEKIKAIYDKGADTEL